MKYLKRFNETQSPITEAQVEEYLQSKYTSDWFNSELDERVYDYISEEDAEEHDGDYVQAYRELSMGGAIEYDILDQMAKDAAEHFGISEEQKIETRTISDICHDHLIDTCSWYDTFVFDRRSTEPYKNKFGGSSYDDLVKGIDFDLD